MNHNLGMDWIDGVLISGMFGLGIGISGFIPGLESMASTIAIVGVFLAPAVRRFFIGPSKYQHTEGSTHFMTDRGRQQDRSLIVNGNQIEYLTFQRKN